MLAMFKKAGSDKRVAVNPTHVARVVSRSEDRESTLIHFTKDDYIVVQGNYDFVVERLDAANTRGTGYNQ